MNNALLSLPKAAVAVATAAVLACGLAPAASASGSGMAAATTENVVNRPHTVGRWLVDDSGRVVTFHGENIVNKRAPWTPQALGIGEDDAAFLAKQGFNSVRLGISWAAIEPQPGQYNDAYLAEIKQAIETFNSYGISTFLEYHQDFYTESLGGEGAPQWATFTDGLYNPDMGLAVAQFSPAIQRAFDNFFNNRTASDGVGIRDHYVNMWGHTAAYFADTPGIIGYGPINEPSAGAETIPCALDFCSESTLQKLRNLNRQVRDVIRRHDSEVGIWLTGYVTTVMGAPAHMGTKPDANTVYAFNSYAQVCTIPLQFPEAVCEPDHRKAINQSWAYANSQNMPAVLAEFGASKNPNLLRNQARLSDENMQSRFHWQYGGYDPATTASSWQDQALVINPARPITELGNTNWSNVTQLATPYPSAVAGTPTGWKTDGAFTATWNTARADGSGAFDRGAETTIKVPNIWAPNGYRVHVAGGHAANTPADGIFRDVDLRIAADAGAVKVTVTPA
ncbi:cellulase family glycosylhydrolase [Corynebacterium phoceense]|uniref:cellulase family glycosylhydrolase n=1 Tax=Corynebacterium phoceense TaxID=1686286 RepID=UPI001D602CE4|nr:cellulase family glycosylhydrolase [Corynebacterium phoceense]HJG43020.1 cellulase family glycosylhydrolase [Corynebacterium phoceense]